jgi:hypothetical protein
MRYTDEFLIKGLKKKNVDQLTLIYDNIIQYRYKELDAIGSLFYTFDLETINYKYKTGEIISYKKPQFIHLSKCDKIDVIVSFFNRADDVVNLERVDCIIRGNTMPTYEIPAGNFDGDALYFQKRELKIEKQAEFSEKIFKLYILIVSILKNLKKRPKSK